MIRLRPFNIVTYRIHRLLLQTGLILFFLLSHLQVVEVLLPLIVALVVFVLSIKVTLVALIMVIILVIGMHVLDLLGVRRDVGLNEVAFEIIGLVVASIASAASLLANGMVVPVLVFVLSHVLLRFLSINLIVGVGLNDFECTFT